MPRVCDSKDVSETAGALTASQQEIIDLLGAKPADRPRFDFALRHQLRATLEHHLEPVAEQLPDGEKLWIAKHSLTGVHGCEVRFLAEEKQPFEYSIPMARGTVAHRSIELGIHLKGEWAPADLVDEALARTEEETSAIGEWLRGVSEVEKAELRAAAVERVTAFNECWPPLEARWRPVTEARQRQELCDGRIILSGKVDLALGKADGDVAGKVIVDFKTGGFQVAHRDDLRFYALLDTLKIGTPPRLLASYYLDQGKPEVEQVTEDLLDAAAARVVDGARHMIELRTNARTAVHRPGPPCRWCIVRQTCEPGRAYLRADPDDLVDW
jgi:hypothetical protein